MTKKKKQWCSTVIPPAAVTAVKKCGYHFDSITAVFLHIYSIPNNTVQIAYHLNVTAFTFRMDSVANVTAPVATAQTSPYRSPTTQTLQQRPLTVRALPHILLTAQESTHRMRTIEMFPQKHLFYPACYILNTKYC